MRILMGILGCLLAVAGVRTVMGQEAPTRPAEPHVAASPLPGSRAVRVFDFEERKLGNFESVPMYWSKVVGRGYPAYSGGGFDGAVARSATTSFKLETHGGSVAYRLTPPADKRIPIQANSDYYILAFVRTSQLKHARADLGAWFADGTGALMTATEQHSQPYAAGAAKGAVGGAGGEADAWNVLYIYMPGPEADAGAAEGEGGQRSLVLQVGLVQPQQMGGAEKGAAAGGLGRFEIYQQDIQGAVWFDDIVVFQLPRVGVTVPRNVVGSMFLPTDKVKLDLIVSDLSAAAAAEARALDVRLKVADPEGLVLVSERWRAAVSAEKAWTIQYEHAPLPPGLYTATLEVAEAADGRAAGELEKTLIARRQTTFMCLPKAGGGGTAERPAAEFGLGIRGWSTRGYGGSDAAMMARATEVWPAILRQTGAGLVQLPAWRHEMSEDAVMRRDQPFDGLLSALQRLDVRTIGTLAEVPGSLAGRLPPSAALNDSLLQLLGADPKLWRPYVNFTLTRYANRIDHWELGTPEVPFSGVMAGPVAGGVGGANELSERYVQLYERTYGEMAGLLNRPQVLIPWNGLFDFDAKQFPHAVLDLRLPAAIKPAHIPAYIDNFRQAGAQTRPATAPATGPAARPAGAPIFVHLDALEPSHYTHGDRLADFAQRVVFARSANPQAILFDLLPTPRPGAELGSAGAGGPPDELLLVYRTLIHALGNSVYVGELPIATGVRAFLFNRNGSGTVVLWNDSAEVGELPLELPLGGTPQLTDLFGNALPLPVNAVNGLARLTITSTPVILEQLDPRPLQLKTSYAMADTTLPAGAGTVKTEILLKNPYSDVLSGTLRLQPPKGWSAEPSTQTVSIAPGATYRLPVTVRYPFTENAGTRQFGGRLSIEQGSVVSAQQLDLNFPVSITSDLVELEGFTQMLDNGDVVVQQMITNISDAPLNAQAYAILPGFARQQRYVLTLPPGQTVIKRFTFQASTFVGAGGGGGGAAPMTAADMARALEGKVATVGLRQNDGTTLLTKSIPLE